MDSKLAAFFGLVILIVLGGVLALGEYRKEKSENLSATSNFPKVVALFETSLASRITADATSFTLVSATDKDGNTLASSTYAFVIDEGTSNEEFVLADCTATACTNATRGVSVLTGTTTVSALKKAHGRGASVKITDGPILLIHNRLLQGIDSFPNGLYYTSTMSTTTLAGLANSQVLASVAYVNYVGSTGCSDATESVRGCGELATGAEAASSTSLGSTGARLILPSTLATDTPNTATRASRVLMSDLNGYIKQGWINLTEAFTFAKLTTTATTTIPASGVSSNPLVLNSVAYRWPSTQGASSTALLTDGAGGLSWASVPGVSILTSTTSQSSSGNAATTTLHTYVVPANTLGTTIGRYIEVEAMGTTANDCMISIEYGTGSATSSIGWQRIGDTNLAGRVQGIISATSSSSVIGSGTASGGVGSFGPFSFVKGYSLASPTYISYSVKSLSSTCYLNLASAKLISN